jgi:4-amino-4-deoxy-L-arabinose transferase-like glycosyltransferase
MKFAQCKKILIYTVVTVIALTIRFYTMNGKESWHDEWHSIYVSDPNIELNQTMDRYWGNKGDTFLTEYYPPLYLILLKFFFKLFGYTDEMGRVFSLIFGILSIPLSLYIFENITKNNKINYYFGLALAFNLFLIWQSLEIRAHSLSMFLSLLSVALFLKILKKNNKIIYLFYFLISLLNLSIWPITLTIYFGKIIFLLKKFIFEKKEKKIKMIILNIFFIIIFYIILNYNYLFYNINRTEHYTLLKNSFFINYHFRSFFGSIALGGVLLIIFTYFILKNKKEIIFNNSNSNLIIYIIISTYALTLLYSIFRAPIMSPKYVMFILPLIIIWIFTNIPNEKNKKLLNIILTLLIIVVGIFNLKNFPIKSPPTTNVLEIIIKNNGKHFFTSENDVFNNYIKTKKIFIKNQLILIENKKQINELNIREIWFICLNNPSFAVGDNNFPDEKKCTQNNIPTNYKLNQFIHIKDFVIKSYIKA